MLTSQLCLCRLALRWETCAEPHFMPFHSSDSIEATISAREPQLLCSVYMCQRVASNFSLYLSIGRANLFLSVDRAHLEFHLLLVRVQASYTLKNEGKRFAVAKGQLGNVASASAGLFLRGGMGVFVQGYKPRLTEAESTQYTSVHVSGRMLKEESEALKGFKRPDKTLILYEFNACPFCKKVREMVTYLDLDVEFRPCPRDSKVFRPEAIARGGKSMFPYLVDPNTTTEMYESDDIIRYLANTYGDGTVPLALKLGPVTALSAGFSALPRLGRGARYQAAKMPEKPLVFWGYEASPFCQLVREKLVEFELPHIQISCARGSPKRQQMFDKYGKFQVPLLEDPNTLVAMFESADIIKYLEDTYASLEVATV